MNLAVILSFFEVICGVFYDLFAISPLWGNSWFFCYFLKKFAVFSRLICEICVFFTIFLRNMFWFCEVLTKFTFIYDLLTKFAFILRSFDNIYSYLWCFDDIFGYFEIVLLNFLSFWDLLTKFLFILRSFDEIRGFFCIPFDKICNYLAILRWNLCFFPNFGTKFTVF